MTSGCYRADAVWRFLEDCWGFQQQASDTIRSIDPELARRSHESIDKVRQWSRGFEVFGPTLFLGMAVLHNVQVKRHLDPGDNKLGLVAMTNWGDYEGGGPDPTHHGETLPVELSTWPHDHISVRHCDA